MVFECKQCGKCCSQFDNSSGGIMIFEWEKEKLEQIAKAKSIEFKIEPGQINYDAKSNTKIISTYAFKARACPFLKNKKCLIHSQRPIYCKAYPLMINMSKNKFKLNLLDCPNTIIPSSDKLIDYYSLYKEIFLYALELEIFRHRYLDIIKNLEKNKLIEIIKENNLDNPKTNTLFEFLVKNKFLLQEDIDKIINDILNLSSAKTMIGIN